IDREPLASRDEVALGVVLAVALFRAVRRCHPFADERFTAPGADALHPRPPRVCGRASRRALRLPGCRPLAGGASHLAARAQVPHDLALATAAALPRQLRRQAVLLSERDAVSLTMPLSVLAHLGCLARPTDLATAAALVVRLGPVLERTIATTPTGKAGRLTLRE